MAHKRRASYYCNILMMLLVLALCFVSSLGDTNAQILMRFKASLSNNNALDNWVNESSLCSWRGLLCYRTDQTFYGLRLENMSLGGKIDVDTLMLLPNLTSFSVNNNTFEGPMPEFKKLVRLRALFLSKNKFSGDIADDAFEGMTRLKKLFLAENGFTGHIPNSLVDLPRIWDLDLYGNAFEGNIPEFQQKGFRTFNLSHNQLVGPIPKSLSNMDPTSFAGNKGLCEKPMTSCIDNIGDNQSTSPNPNSHQENGKKHRILITFIIVVSVVVVASIVALLFIRSLRRKRLQQPLLLLSNKHAKSKNNGSLKESSHSTDLTSDFKKGGGDGELNFLREEKGGFDLQELLSASAVVLGSGSLGSTYKAMILNGPTMVVKRFRHMNSVGRQEFIEHMQRLGSLTHPNLLPLSAFYYRKEDKFLVYDYAENGSLATHLHGKSNESVLTWSTRLKIIKGVARGLGYLYENFPGQNLPHGHLKSSNVVLDHSFEPKLSEYGLVAVMNKSHAQRLMAAYKAPEVNQFGRPNVKSDVWCLGILILELLTGKFPANYLRHGGGNNGDLATWVDSVVREEWTGEVFDKEMVVGRRNSGEGEMLKLLRIGMFCCKWNVESRWDWREALARIEELKERDSNGEEEYSSYVSEGDLYSRTMTEDEFSFSITN